MTHFSPGRDVHAWIAELRATASLTWPLVLANLAQVAMQTTDVAMMGWLGKDALAAGALGANLYFLFLIFGIGLTMATAPMLARELGANRHAVREVRRTVRQGLWTAAILSVPIWFILWQAASILGLLGQDLALAAEAQAYVRTLQWSVLPALGFIVLRSFTAALERPGWALAVALAAIVFNAIADWVLMFGKLGFPAFGIAGAGIATTLSNLFLFVGLAVVLVRHPRFRRYRIFGRFWRPDWPRLAALWRLGLPMAATLTFEVSIFNAAAFAMGLIGPASLAAYQIAIQIASIAFMVPMGVGQAATVRVGRAFGAGDIESVRLAGSIALGLGIGFMTVTAIVMWLVPHALLSPFLDTAAPANADVVQLAVAFLAVAAIFQIVDGAQAVGLGVLRGLHDTRVPMIFALVGYWVIGFPLGLVLAFSAGLGGVGIWVGLAMGLAVVAALLLWRWQSRERLGLLGAAAAPGPP